MKKVKTEQIDRGFAQKIADKYTNLQLFTTDFTPIISTKRIIPRMTGLELIYALSYLVLRREILNSFKKTKNVFTSVKQIWNIFVHLDFPLSRYEYITTRLHRFSREIMKIQDPRSKIQVKQVSSPYVNLVKSRFKSSSMELTQPLSHETSRIEIEKESAVPNYQLPAVPLQPSLVSHEPFTVSNKNLEASVLTGVSNFITPLFSYYSKLPLAKLAQPVSQETAKVAVTNYQLPVATSLLPAVSHKPAEIMNDKQMNLNTSWVDKAPLYHTYPKIEHLTSTHTEIIKERIIEKEEESKPPHATPQSAIVDVNHLADQVYSFIERKIRIEKERRGFYG